MNPTVRCTSSSLPAVKDDDIDGRNLLLYLQLSDGGAAIGGFVTDKPREAYTLLEAGASILRRE